MTSLYLFFNEKLRKKKLSSNHRNYSVFANNIPHFWNPSAKFFHCGPHNCTANRGVHDIATAIRQLWPPQSPKKIIFEDCAGPLREFDLRRTIL
jgi:hypothetical protein